MRKKLRTKSKAKRPTLASQLAALREECARIAEEHVCGYDCYSEITGEATGCCRYDIAYMIRRSGEK